MSLNGTSVDCQLALIPGRESKQGKIESGNSCWSLRGGIGSELDSEERLDVPVKDNTLEVRLVVEDV